jgi:preprotein translocase subunit SecY
MPLHRRVPKRGFTNIFRIEYAVVNLDQLEERFEAGTTVTPEALRERRPGASRKTPVKVLARGEVDQGAHRAGHKFSGKAAEKIAAAGGRAGSDQLNEATPVVESLRNLFAVVDLRNRVLFTLALLAVYRVGNHIPTPGVNPEALAVLAQQAQNTMFGLYDMFSGYNLSRMTIFALGVMPYISASIILQLLTVVWPYLERLSKEGELGRRKITQYTRYSTIVLASSRRWASPSSGTQHRHAGGGLPLVYDPGWGFRPADVLTLTTGTMFMMWLGEQITERGIGNGMSLIIFAGIVVGSAAGGVRDRRSVAHRPDGLLVMALLVVMMVLVIAAIIYVERGHRRITVQYAKRVVVGVSTAGRARTFRSRSTLAA